MTYRAALQKLQRDLEHVYIAAGQLRDRSNSSEQEAWNEVRTYTREAGSSLEFLDKTITQIRADTELNLDV